MKRFAEQLKKQSQSVRLRAAERNDLKDRLVSYMEYHPLPKTEAERNAAAYIRSESFSVIHLSTPYVRGFMGAFAMLILIVIPVVAERAVPGDVLYPVKVNFNEEIRSTLAVSPYAKVEWETERLERRIAEARLLASEGRLTDEAQAEFAEAVKIHSDAAQEGIAAIRETDSDEAAIAEIAFESALTVQSEVLEGALEKETSLAVHGSTTPGHSVAALAGAVEEARKSATANQSGVTPSYEKLVARMEFETTRAYELFSAVKEVASEEEVTNIERRLADIERKIEDAATIHDGVEVEGVATTTSTVLPEVALLRTALSDLQKLISFMTDIDVRENVTIEELIPVTLTPEERTEAVKKLQTEVDVMLDQVTEVLGATPEDSRTEKFETGLDTATDLAASSVSALLVKDLDTAENTIKEAYAILNDILSLLSVDVELAEPVVRGTTTTSTTTADFETGSSTEGVASSTEKASTTDESSNDGREEVE